MSNRIATLLLFAAAACHTPHDRVASPRVSTPVTAAAAPHVPGRADLMDPPQQPLAEMVGTQRPCTAPILDPLPAVPKRQPIGAPRLFLSRDRGRCLAPIIVGVPSRARPL